ncbi:protein kinase domain-containing protein [Kineococcus sp. SYSU DK003]|uniref:protein kinase domain-containing protein n=1 Tax=Kineococcus sp. SYSU DK003 TaxID=3383124 RepID=UPI003D7E316C
MTLHRGDEPATDGLQPWTIDESSLLDVQSVAGTAVPTVGVWAGPPEDPARYELLEPVGGGAEGRTFRAQYRPAPSAQPVPVAVKQFLPPPGASLTWPHDGTWPRLSQQFRVLAGVRQNPHLVDTREVFLGAISTAPEELVPFVVMEWVDGRSPVDMLADGGVSLRTRLAWVEDLAAALRTLRSLSTHPGNAVVHGDVKPENCLITSAGALVLIDLGAATHAEGGARAGLHTPGFAAPEVVAAPGSSRTFASDAYSLGATAFAFLTGHSPSVAKGETFAQDVTEAVVHAPALRAVGSPRHRRRLAEHLLLLLDPDPERRQRHDTTRWAQALRTLGFGRGRRVRQRTLATALVAAAALGTTYVLDVPPFHRAETATGSSEQEALVQQVAAAYDDAAHTIQWDQLPEDGPLLDPRTQASWTFPEDSEAWPTVFAGAAAVASAQGYDVHVTDASLITDIPAPVVATSREVLTSKVSIVSGQGAVGLFCRGGDLDAGERYAFMFSHAGAVGIFEPDDPGGEAGANSTGFWYLHGIDLRDGVELQASCRDEGAKVVLQLAVNGKTVLTYEPTKILGPSRSGVEVYSFGGVESGGEDITARVTSFAQLSTA